MLFYTCNEDCKFLQNMSKSLQTTVPQSRQITSQNQRASHLYVYIHTDAHRT